jgi:hypothetical protein
MTLRGQALHVYTYLDAARHATAVQHLADACVRLDMTDLTENLIVRSLGPWPRRLRSAPASDRIYQALEYVSVRLTAVLVCLAPKHDTLTWRELDREWRRVAAPFSDDECVGRVRLFYALYDGGADRDRLAAAASAALPGEPILTTSAVLDDGICMWEAFANSDDRLERVLVLLAPSSRVAQGDALVWPAGNAAMPPLAGYLWQMAIVRHEARRFVERRATSQPDRLYENAEKHGIRSADQREQLLDALQRETALAAAAEAALRTMRRTVQAAADNAGAWHEPIADDRDYVTWLLGELDDAVGGMRDVVGYAEPMGRIGLAETERRLRDLGARSEFLTILQTSVIAAAALTLAASQAINYGWPTYASLQTPFIVLMTFLGLAAPVGTAALNLRARRALVRWAAVTVVGLGAALGWFLTAWLTRWQTGHPSHIMPSVAAAAVGAAVLLSLGWGSRRAVRSRRNSR